MIKNCKKTAVKIIINYQEKYRIQDQKIERLYIIIRNETQRTTRAKQNAVDFKTKNSNNKLAPQIFAIL